MYEDVQYHHQQMSKFDLFNSVRIIYHSQSNSQSVYNQKERNCPYMLLQPIHCHWVLVTRATVTTQVQVVALCRYIAITPCFGAIPRWLWCCLLDPHQRPSVPSEVLSLSNHQSVVPVSHLYTTQSRRRPALFVETT